MSENTSNQENCPKEIWVVGELENGTLSLPTLELLSKARELAGSAGFNTALVISGYKIPFSLSDSLRGSGISKLYLADSEELEFFHEEAHAELIAVLAGKYHPHTILGSATARGRSLMPRIAVLLGTGLTADCTGLEINPETRRLIQTRPAFGGNIIASIICEKFPQMATVRPHVFKTSQKADTGDAEEDIELIRYKGPSPASPAKRTISLSRSDPGEAGLADADIIVSAGMGTGGPEGVALVKSLATELNAGFGASRPVVDSGWLDYSHQVGQTGITVHPKVYMAFGISGAVQHLAGMQGSDCIIAVNSDPDAPIFKFADVIVNADLREIIPELIKALR